MTFGHNPLPIKTVTAEVPASAELKRLRAQVGEALANLRKQGELLRLRNLAVPQAVLEALVRVDVDLRALEVSVSQETTEIDQLRALGSMSALINSSLDVDTILAQAMGEMLARTGAERGFILLQDAATGDLNFRVARTADDDDPLDPDQLEDVSRTIVRQVLESGQPMLTDNASVDKRLQDVETIARFVLRSIMCVPLVFKERVQGVVYVDNKYREGVFTDREVRLLIAFANQATVAIENALLYSRVQETLVEINRARVLIENVFASISSGIITTGADDRVTTFNQAAGEILNVQEESAIGQPLAALPPLRDDFAATVRTVREGKQPALIDAQPTIPGRGQLTLNVRLSPLKNADGRTQGVAMVLDDLTEQREREESLRLMNRYLPPGMVENIHQIADLALGGERREVTCIFMSVCQFSDFPADLRPAQRMQLLNLYLETATDVIHRARGVIDKYLGNEIMILFNTQLNPDSQHALHAVEMALEARDAFLRLYERLAIAPDPHQYCIGMHTGVATLGNVGSQNRRSFTAIGDTINLTKRIQESRSGGEIVMSGDTYNHLRKHARMLPGIRVTEREPMQARGRQAQTPIYEVHRA